MDRHRTFLSLVFTVVIAWVLLGPAAASAAVAPPPQPISPADGASFPRSSEAEPYSSDPPSSLD
jgi:hypothetical protein